MSKVLGFRPHPVVGEMLRDRLEQLSVRLTSDKKRMIKIGISDFLKAACAKAVKMTDDELSSFIQEGQKIEAEYEPHILF